jgi:hypothetical protein
VEVWGVTRDTADHFKFQHDEATASRRADHSTVLAVTMRDFSVKEKAMHSTPLTLDFDFCVKEKAMHLTPLTLELDVYDHCSYTSVGGVWHHTNIRYCSHY